MGGEGGEGGRGGERGGGVREGSYIEKRKWNYKLTKNTKEMQDQHDSYGNSINRLQRKER